MNSKNRQDNKSNGPWGMHEFDFTYRKVGDPLEKNRFISAPSEESAIEQFNYIMKKANIKVDVVSVEQANE